MISELPEQNTEGEPHELTPQKLKNLAFAFLRDGQHLGDALTAIDPNKFAERIRRIQAGLNAEKEFHALMTWLGECDGIYAIDDPGGGQVGRRLENTIRLVFWSDQHNDV